MITKTEYEIAVAETLKYFDEAKIKLIEKEKQNIEVADFALSNLKNVGLQILTYINTERVCAKEMVLFPYQTCPQHKHIDSEKAKGKEETFRCRKGKVYLYVSGLGRMENIKAKMPATKVDVFNEIILNEGEQYTLYPNTWHWFQAGQSGAVISEFSTMSSDETDIFLDERIKREPEVK